MSESPVRDSPNRKDGAVDDQPTGSPIDRGEVTSTDIESTFVDIVEAVRLGPERTVVLDVEPLIAGWNTDDATLNAGLARVGTALPDKDVHFVTNSSRRVDAGSPFFGRYRWGARKPFGPIRPEFIGALFVGDQPLTDGLLAWRHHGRFLRVPLPDRAPRGVRFQRWIGELLFRFLPPGVKR